MGRKERKNKENEGDVERGNEESLVGGKAERKG